MAKLVTVSPHILYFNYLCGLVHVESLPGHMYFSLCSVFYNRAFNVVIRRDNNRERDGLALRRKFEDDTGISLGQFPHKWCSFMEFLVALSFRMQDEVYDEKGIYDASYWFYEMIKNLGLVSFNDYNFHDHDNLVVGSTIDRINRRTFNYNGSGGLFPLYLPQEDQRNVEFAKQMTQYLFEHYKHK